MRAVVAGAGIAGLTTAWWLAEAGWDVVVAERSPGPRSAGYVIDFFGPGYEVAERMGLLPAIEAARAPVDELRYVDPRGRSLGGAAYEVFGGAVAGRVVSLRRGALADALLAAVRDRVELRWGDAVVGGDGDAGVVRYADGRTEEVDLLVGADGLRSRVRDAVVLAGDDAGAGSDGVVRPLGYHTAAFVLHDDDVRRRLGRRAVLVAVPGRQVAFYPADDDGVAAWFLHEDDGPVPADPVAVLHARYRGMGPAVDRALAALDPATDLYYDQVAQVRVPRWSRGRAVLVGDACQAPSLMAGQGASMAMTGGWALAHHLGRAGGDVVGGVERYVRAMRPFAEQRQATGRTTARWLLPDSAWRIHVRQAVIGAARLPGSGALVRRVFATSTRPELPE